MRQRGLAERHRRRAGTVRMIILQAPLENASLYHQRRLLDIVLPGEGYARVTLPPLSGPTT